MESHGDIFYNEIFTDIYKEFYGPLTGFLYRIVYSWDISEELTQDVFMKIFEKRIPLSSESAKTRNFLFVVARNCALDYLKRKKVESEKTRESSFEEIILNDRFYESLEDSYLKGEVVSTLHDCIKKIPEKKRKIFMEKHFYQCSDVDITTGNNTTIYKIKKIDDEVQEIIRNNLDEYFE